LARINVYVPDDLAARSRAAGLNVSALTQQAISAALSAAATDAWLDGLSPRPSKVTTEAVLTALDESREEFGDGG